MESPKITENLQTLYQRKAQETRNTVVPLPWSKSCCGGRQTRFNSRPNLFSSYLSNGEESEEKDHGNEFRGSKNWGREVWVSLEWPKNSKIRRPKVAAAAAFAGPIRARPMAVGRELSWRWSSGGGAPPWPTGVARWWAEASPTAKTRLA